MLAIPSYLDGDMARTKHLALQAFGGVLRHLRERRRRQQRLQKLSTTAVARLVRSELFKRTSRSVSFDGSTLWRWEEGEVRKTDPLVLRELAAVYGIDFERLLNLLECNLRVPLLTIERGLALVDPPKSDHLNPGEQPGDVQARAHSGGPHVGASDRRTELDAARLAEVFVQFPSLFPSITDDPQQLAAELASTGALLLRVADALIWRQIAVAGAASPHADEADRIVGRPPAGGRGRKKS